MRGAISINGGMKAHMDDEELESLANLEAEFHQEGVDASRAAGALSGQAAGHEMGWHAGAAVSSELMFYLGAAVTFLKLHEAHADDIEVTYKSGKDGTPDNESSSLAKASIERAIVTAGKLVDVCSTDSMPHIVGNSMHVDFDATLATARTLFRQFVAQAGMPSVKFEAKPSTQSQLAF